MNGSRLTGAQAPVAATLAGLVHLGPVLATTTAPDGDKAPFTYHELDGLEGSERYLLSANSGRALEHAILTGAEKRLGRPVRSLHDLDDYYHVGPVEQYLMPIGRV